MPEFFPAYRKERNQKPILFKNARIYDGSDVLTEPKDVLVLGNLIQDVGSNISSDHWSAVTVDCSGYTLMPGLIDMHSHLCIQEGMLEGRDTYDQMAMGAMCGQDCVDYLLQGGSRFSYSVWTVPSGVPSQRFGPSHFLSSILQPPFVYFILQTAQPPDAH